MGGWWWVLVEVKIGVVGFVMAVCIRVRLGCSGGWHWLAVGVAVVVKERERHSSKIKIILFK